jgi:hypothetical protein
MIKKCNEYVRLENETSKILGKLVELTSTQREGFVRRDYDEFMKLDKELELTIGLKERTIGALRQHSKEHQCWPENKITKLSA